MGRKLTITKEMEDMYLSGKGIIMTSRTFNILPDTLKHYLIKRKLLRENSGKYAEDLVEKFLTKNKVNFQRQKGDAPFDFLVNNKRVDVKSASLTRRGKNQSSYHYIFSIINKNLNKNIVKDCDEVWLYFKDKELLASIKSKYLYNLTNLDLPSIPSKSKIYSLTTIGYIS